MLLPDERVWCIQQGTLLRLRARLSQLPVRAFFFSRELILHRMRLEPIILGNRSAAGDTIIEKLERYLRDHGNVGFLS